MENAEFLLKSEFSGLSILLVEDDPISCEVALTLLADTGFVVSIADDGAEALRLARENQFALILMDIQMPIMDGLEASRQIRLLAQHQSTPIFALTANCFGEDKQACLAAGMNELISKPVNPDELFSTILRWLADP